MSTVKRTTKRLVTVTLLRDAIEAIFNLAGQEARARGCFGEFVKAKDCPCTVCKLNRAIEKPRWKQ